MPDRPLAMVVFASEQLWPNIYGLLPYAASIDHLYIYATHDPKKSLGPAKRLAQLVEGWIGPGKVEPPVPSSKEPQDVAATLEDWYHRHPDAEWVINITGGLKLMTLGVVPIAAFPNVSLIYREFDGWRSIRPSGGGFCSTPLSVDESAAARLPIDDLIMVQFGPYTREVWNGSAPANLDLAPLVAEGVESGWSWSQLVSGQGVPVHRHGPAFEQFVAASIRAIGVDNVRVNVSLQDRRGGQAMFESDVIANTGRNLVLFDCKLRGSEDRHLDPLSSKIDESARKAADLGGLGGRAVLVRPNREGNRALRLYAANKGVTLLCRAEMPELYTRLAATLGVALPEPMRELQRSWASRPPRR